MAGLLKKLSMTSSDWFTLSCKMQSGSLVFPLSVVLMDSIGLGVKFGHLELFLTSSRCYTSLAYGAVGHLG